MGLGAGVAAAAAVGAVGAVASGVIQANAAKDAAKAQADANAKGIAAQQSEQAQTRADLAPYNQTGQDNLGMYGGFYKTSADQLGAAYSDAAAHIPQPMTQANLEQTPGYQFNLSQGMKAVQNSAAAKGLGVSGAAMNSAANFATGLSDSTYQNQFANQQSIYNDYLNQAQLKGNQLNQIFGQIQAPVTTGLNAAAKTGELGQQNVNAQSALLNNTGVANAAGINGAAQGYANAINGVANSASNGILMNSLNTPTSASGVRANTAQPGYYGNNQLGYLPA